MEYIGNEDLLKLPKTAFLSSRNIYIIENADNVVFGSLDKTGSLYPLYLDALENEMNINVINVIKDK